ncbi:fumarylacetoacetate hydrolase family protein [Edaphobacillus lindanitolerans]|uniref:2-keto-4-pentenoate hydratase/2-oxohepta-3-ene-1,7-dioic acid hydratase (Catechol pathway) n=1 Tax=Edaphobacillus lindanitolerans TaxID=550447 RepID=A0A1U7PLM4_9BACI|nr:fumarylacetoacetate hydrolase family protein [Edaphobacillus lindanitolerans]SIT68984.1 2-keto-4-pentenoate hydratase/2-oxohepta-3-ene-1,7-dioic acid hydratase (catechol pathway) [Edaphobacillus lindanitolerans]
MKLLSFRYGGEQLFGPKVKREEAVWDVIAIQEELGGAAPFPRRLIDGVGGGMEFVEQIRKLVSMAESSDRAGEFKHSFDEIEWTAPIPRTPKNVICIGKNYADHATEMGAERPPEKLVVFTKSPLAIAADEEELPVHAGVTENYDYEGELAVIIGKGGRHIKKALAFDHIFGYSIANDLTAREVQAAHQQFFLGKSLDKSCPMGPYIVTKDEIPDPQKLSLVTKVNDEVRQNGHTGNMIFPVDELIAQVSTYVTLEPGDVILTGTPAGVGKGMKPPKFLKAGDTVKVSIEGIGTLSNTFA